MKYSIFLRFALAYPTLPGSIAGREAVETALEELSSSGSTTFYSGLARQNSQNSLGSVGSQLSRSSSNSRLLDPSTVAGGKAALSQGDLANAESTGLNAASLQDWLNGQSGQALGHASTDELIGHPSIPKEIEFPAVSDLAKQEFLRKQASEPAASFVSLPRQADGQELFQPKSPARPSQPREMEVPGPALADGENAMARVIEGKSASSLFADTARQSQVNHPVAAVTGDERPILPPRLPHLNGEAPLPAQLFLKSKLTRQVAKGSRSPSLNVAPDGRVEFLGESSNKLAAEVSSPGITEFTRQMARGEIPESSFLTPARTGQADLTPEAPLPGFSNAGVAHAESAGLDPPKVITQDASSFGSGPRSNQDPSRLAAVPETNPVVANPATAEVGVGVAGPASKAVPDAPVSQVAPAQAAPIQAAPDTPVALVQAAPDTPVAPVQAAPDTSASQVAPAQAAPGSSNAKAGSDAPAPQADASHPPVSNGPDAPGIENASPKVGNNNG